MSITRPFRRTARPRAPDNKYFLHRLVHHPKFAINPGHYVRAFGIIQQDFQKLIEYIEPADENEKAFSFRIHELLVRTSIEVEANLKAILLENGYAKQRDLKMKDDYLKVERSHRLSAFRVQMPFWRGVKSERTPFSAWANGQPLPWYQDYNAVKHDRNREFPKATFASLVDAISGLAVVLSAQFVRQSFIPTDRMSWAIETEFVPAIGDFFQVRFPTDWPQNEWYELGDELALMGEVDPFANYPY
jgi:hypothetical protein